MGHQWVKNGNRVSIEYMDGVKEFLDVARKTLNSKGLTLCPCANCVNSRLRNINVINSHLINVGIDKSYTRWVYHGEDEVNEEDTGHDVYDNDESASLRAGLEDAIGHPVFNIGPTNDLIGNQQTFIENTRYEKLHEALNNPLYEGCTNVSTLMFVVKMMNFKVMNKWTNSSFEMTLKFLHSILPDGNNCPQSYYDVRMLLCEVGLGYELIDVCQYDCAIFYGENKDAKTCPVCQSSRYVRNKIAYKKLRYFPITPRLKRLYASRHTAKDMRWHKEVRKDEQGVLRHPADGRAWKHFDEVFLYLFVDTVYQAEQEVGDGLASKKRGITCGMGARKVMKASKKKLVVEFDFQMRRVKSENESSFMYECGYILRNNCSLQYKEWRHVPSDVRLPLRHKLTTLFDIDVEDSKVCQVIDSYMARAWRGHRAKLHDYFKTIQGMADPTKAKTTPPSGTSKEDWDYLCDMWSDTKYLENAEKKVMARGKRKVDSRNGSKSTIRYHLERGQDLDASSGQIETWRLTHWDAEQGWISAEAATLYEAMMKLRNENSVASMSDKLILEKVLGRDSVRLHGWGRDPTDASNTMGTSQKLKRLTYDELVDEFEALKAKYAVMEQALIERNIMPPPTTTTGPSQGDTSEFLDIDE